MFDESFHNKLNTVQYNAALAITGSIWETNNENLCQELGLESLWIIHLVVRLQNLPKN